MTAPQASASRNSRLAVWLAQLTMLRNTKHPLPISRGHRMPGPILLPWSDSFALEGKLDRLRVDGVDEDGVATAEGEEPISCWLGPAYMLHTGTLTDEQHTPLHAPRQIQHYAPRTAGLCASCRSRRRGQYDGPRRRLCAPHRLRP